MSPLTIMERLAPKEQRTVAIGLLAVLLIVGYFGVVEPIVEAYQEYDEHLENLQDRLVGYERVSADKGLLQRQFNQIKKQASKEQVGYFTGGTHALAAAKIQDYVKRVVEENGGRLNSIQILPEGETQEKDAVPITLRVQISGNVATVQKVLYTLESAQPRMFIDNLYLRGRSAYNYSGRQADDQLDIRFHLSGYIQSVSS